MLRAKDFSASSRDERRELLRSDLEAPVVQLAHAGRKASATDMQALQEVLNTAVGQLLQFYAGKTEAPDTLAAIHQAMEGLAWHRGNVEKHLAPELDFQEEQA